MPMLSRSKPGQHGEAIDLTTTASASSSSVPISAPRPQLIDLTTPNPVPNSPRDHMHAVVTILRPGAIDLMQNTFDGGRKGMVVGNASSPRRKFQSPRFPLDQSPTRESNRSVVDKQHARKSGQEAIEPFPFMAFPPEIRNCVYKMLLTTPNNPIEFAEHTGRNRARRAANWEKCTTWKMRRKHKTIFLEILGVSKQVHAEASGILYGCNVFKYRSDCDGKGSRPVMLPTRHLQLLKHIKISVISESPHMGQDQWVADLVKQFVKDGLKLESFEMTWFGWKRYHLKAGGLVYQALLCLDVERYFVVKITGEARMEKKMEEELERALPSKLVEILRPVKPITGDDLSDEDEV